MPLSKLRTAISIIVLLITSGIAAQDITGKWNGLLKFPGGQLRLSINVTKTETGYSATMDSPDQGVGGVPVPTVAFENNNFVFAIPEAKIEYRGVLENNTIKGT